MRGSGSGEWVASEARIAVVVANGPAPYASTSSTISAGVVGVSGGGDGRLGSSTRVRGRTPPG